jgi:hypothetical protein
MVFAQLPCATREPNQGRHSKRAAARGTQSRPTATLLVVWCVPTEAGALSESTATNLVVLALLDLPGYKWAEWLSTRRGFSTRRATEVTFGICGTLLVGVAAAATLGCDARPLAFAGKVFAAAAFQLVYVLTADVFPVSIQSTSFGICSTCARAASICVPALAGKLSVGAASLVSATLALAAAASAHALGKLGVE